jgi:peptide/nickel transport system substrate-binding protein
MTVRGVTTPAEAMMDRREFNTWLATAGLLGAAGIPFSIAGAQAQTKPGTLNSIVQPEPPTLILGLNQQGPTQTVAGKIYESLLTYGLDLAPMPGLADSWTISEDGKTYTFKLAKGITWHDGKPFSADDVVFTTSKFLMETHPRARAIFERCESITAPDPETVVFKLKEPFGPFLQAFEVSTCPIMPKHLYENTDFRNNPANQNPVGTGPFKLQQWVRGSHIHLVKHEAYYRPGLPKLNEIYYRVIPDAASRSLALETGQVQLTQFGDVETFDVPRLRQLPHITLTTKGYEFFAPLAWLDLNNRVKPLDDKRVRQAILYALDRTFIRDKIWFGLGRIPTGPINSATKFYDAKVKTYEHSPDKAKALLAEAGKKPGEVKLKLLQLPYGEVWTRTGEYVKQALSKVGIEVTLESADVAGWSKRVADWDYEMTFNYLYQYGDPALGVARSYISTNIRKGVLFSNMSGYSNPEVDKAFAEGAATADVAKRQAAYSQAQQILAEEVPVAWFLEIEFPTMYDKSLQNLITTGIGVNDTFKNAERKT